MGFGDAIRVCFSQYVTFSGRASRSEFWYWVLFVFLVSTGCSIVDAAVFKSEEAGVLTSLFSLATFLPYISVCVRRLHDVDRSGWWFWLILIPLIGWLVLLIWNCTKGTTGDNHFGTDPLALIN